MPHDDDRVFRALAERYIEQQGAQYRQELQGQPLYATPRLDHLVRTRTKKHTAARWAAGVTAAAAAFLVVLGLLPRLLQGLDTPVSPDSAVSYAAPGADELLPLTFELPADMRVSASEWDNGQSIYYLRDAARDDVVLVMEPSEEFTPPEGFSAVSAGNGEVVYARSTRDYHLLTFRTQGITYTLSCRYELDTLMTLCRQIL